jgi:Bacteriophage HK97-gp10, putative tail-component
MASKTDLLFSLTGDKRLNARLQKLEANVQHRIARPALQKMLRVIAKAQKSAAPHPVLKRSIGFRLGSARGGMKNKDQETAKVGVNVGKKPGGRLNGKGQVIKSSVQNQIAHLLTTGTVPRWTGQTTRAPGRRGLITKTGNPRRYTGVMKQHLFLKAATESAMPAAIEVGKQSAWEDIKALSSS